MITLNGAQGEGGGQIFRSALTLSMCKNIPITIHHIRAGRKKPGLLRQHLTCLRAAAKITNATVSGDEIGSQSVEFIPKKIQAGHYHFSIGTAGSTVLLFQTLMPVLAHADEPSTLTLEGGTHCSMSPSYEFLTKSFLPTVQALGYRIDTHIERYGFYPVGGGLWTAKIYPKESLSSAPIEWMNRGEVITKKAYTISAKVPRRVTEREVLYLQKKAKEPFTTLDQKTVESPGAGNVVSLQTVFENMHYVSDGFGALGIRAERVAGQALKAWHTFMQSEAAIDEHLADQLLIPLAFHARGKFTTMKPSLHTTTNMDVIEALTGIRFMAQAQTSNSSWLIERLPDDSDG